MRFRKHLTIIKSLSFDPLEGHMLIFPSNLKHGVEMNQSDEDRISIAFNYTH